MGYEAELQMIEVTLFSVVTELQTVAATELGNRSAGGSTGWLFLALEQWVLLSWHLERISCSLKLYLLLMCARKPSKVQVQVLQSDGLSLEF